MPRAGSTSSASRRATRWMSSRSRSRSRSASAGRPVAVTMRTPGHDEELALGFALSEGLQPARARLPDDLAANTVELDAPGFDPARLARSFYTTSSCGVCGKGALEAVAVEAPRVESDLRVTGCARRGASRPAPRGAGGVRGDRRPARDRALRRATARCSACARTSAATTRWTRSSAGRSRPGCLPLARLVLCVSGRLSFELVQKAAVAGCPVLAAVGAPSSLAVAARGRSRRDALRLRARRPPERLHRAVAHRRLTGVLLVGGASRRFGSPKALARARTARRSPSAAGGCSARRATRCSSSARRESSCRSRCSTTERMCARRSPASSPGCEPRRTTSTSFLPVDCPRVTPELVRAARRRRAATPRSRRPARCPARGRSARSRCSSAASRSGALALYRAYDELDVVRGGGRPELARSQTSTPRGDLRRACESFVAPRSTCSVLEQRCEQRCLTTHVHRAETLVCR